MRISRDLVSVSTGIPLALALSASAAIVVAALSAPALQAVVGYPAGEPLYDVLFSICHQYPNRSLWIAGHPCGVCARCLGGYSGILLFALVFSKHLNSIRPAFLCLGGIGLFSVGVGDAVIKIFTTHDGSNAWRLFTGALGGAGIAAILATHWQFF